MHFSRSVNIVPISQMHFNTVSLLFLILIIILYYQLSFIVLIHSTDKLTLMDSYQETQFITTTYFSHCAVHAVYCRHANY